ncbi:TPA: sugar transferase, partial [Campylobacter coli]|nr:sugar transferase [Campylobacter coli]
MHNPHSAVERIKNHLAYKLGQAMIDFSNNGEGYIVLFKKLYKIKKQHKKEQKIYQQTIQVFPQLKYPNLETCPDYNEALRCKFHLSYILGKVLIKTYQTWYRGGGFKLKNDIKKANKEFQIFREIFREFKELSDEALKAIQDNKQVFLKEFPRIKNILKIHQDYQPIIDNIFHNFNYFIQNFDLIEKWLLSDDFNQKYKKENHPYPSLLDPEKLNDKDEKINYHNIPAELAWEMNLPLPPNYEFVGFFLHTNGEKAMERFLKEVGIVLVGAFGYEDGKRYIDVFNFLINETAYNGYKFAIGILDINCQKYDKFCFLLQNKPVLILLRDPIDALKSFINVRHQKDGLDEIFKIDINNTNFDEINDRIVYVHESNGCFNPNTNQKFPTLESIKALSDPNHWMLMY